MDCIKSLTKVKEKYHCIGVPEVGEVEQQWHSPLICSPSMQTGTGQKQSLQTLCGHRCECHMPVVIKACDLGLFRDRNDCG